MVWVNRSLQEAIGGICGVDGFGDLPNDTPGVEAGINAEGRGPGDGVAGVDGRLHGGRPPPPRQKAKVQVNKPVRDQIQHILGDEIAVGHNWHAIRFQPAQFGAELVVVAQAGGGEHRNVMAGGELFHR